VAGRITSHVHTNYLDFNFRVGSCDYMETCKDKNANSRRVIGDCDFTALPIRYILLCTINDSKTVRISVIFSKLVTNDSNTIFFRCMDAENYC
jgi:hypothetical protein